MSTDPTTRISLILRLRSCEDADAWEEFVEIYQPMIWRIAKRLGMNDEDAADACQSTMVRLTQVVDQWSAEPDGQAPKFRGWLYRVARNCMLRQFENNARQVSLITNSESLQRFDPVASPIEFERDYQLEFRRQLFAHVARQIRPLFADNTWQAFWQTYVEDRAAKIVALDLDMKVSAVYVARSRVLKRFREEVLSVTAERWGEASGIEWTRFTDLKRGSESDNHTN